MINQNETMNAKDALSAKLAKAVISVDGNRHLLFQAKDLTAKIDKEKKNIGILGRMMKGNKTTSLSGSGSLTIYYNTSLFTDMLAEMKNTGRDVYFDLIVTNDDPTSEAGEQVVILKDCNIDGGEIALFDADGDMLEQSIDFTFEAWETPVKFKTLTGMNL